MKIQIAVLVLVLACVVVSISGMIRDKCWSHGDCGKRECCAGVSHKYPGACAYQPQLGQKCYPAIRPSSKTQCSCILGTTCSYGYDNSDPNNTDRKFRCVKVVFEPDEIEAEYIPPF
ncbi:uncharacterized protein LOC116298431 [Actinia tenebrosa]|uniref:Uncharacterized protein LOC116298431 n=1 Tax=Actinia tenebrosa TaxID=6105 RepID=A0A6P8I4F8_ACTTE|nr:uncharacterized protein LOC116298431 [Actinia tenebrosa]